MAAQGREVGAPRYLSAGKYAFHTIGHADDFADSDGVTVLSFRQAQEQARNLHTEITKLGSAARAAGAQEPKKSGPYTIESALADYFTEMERDGKKTVKDARTRAKALITPALGHIAVSAVTTHQLKAWLDGVAIAPPRRRKSIKPAPATPRKRRSKAPEPEKPAAPVFDPTDEATQRRRRNSANRTWTTLRAALNFAHESKKLGNPEAWRAVKPFRNVTAARLVYLSVDECRRLINASPKDFRNVVQVALATGCRYGELCALNVRDFDRDNGTLFIAMSKSGKARHIDLTDEGIAILTNLTAGRASSDLILKRANGQPWKKNDQVRPLKTTCEAAKIDPPISIHALRHTWASLAIMAGVPLQVAAENLGHADTRMVERHYGHLAPSYKRSVIREHAPRFGLVADANVETIARKG